MNNYYFKSICFILIICALGLTVSAQKPVFPVKISETSRYFTDQNNNPVFWLGTTQWQIFREYTLDEAKTNIRAHHTYGHNDSWRVLPTWKKALDAPGAVQMGVLKKIFLGLGEWWLLVPDQSVLASGGNTDGEILNLAARHRDGKWIMIYLAAKSTVSVDLSKLATRRKINAYWIDPVTANSTPAGRFKASGKPAFTTPNNLEDAILILR